MSSRMRILSWIAAIIVFGLVIWLLGGALAPYIFAAALAYLLDPIADRLEAAGMPRLLAALLIVGLAVAVLLGAILAVVPLVIGQAADLVEALPDYIARLSGWAQEALPERVQSGPFLQDGIAAAEVWIRDNGLAVLGGVAASSMRVVDIFVFVLVAPIVTFFLLLDWNRIIARIDGWLPRAQAPTIRRLGRESDQALAGFIRGQVTVVLIMMVYYATALTLVGLNFGIVVGIIAGIGTFIPIVGAFVGAVLAMGIALFQFWGEWFNVLLVAAVYFGGNAAEGNILTPKFVGRYVGLHPVWLLMAFSVFAALFGFLGVLIAVPLAAVLGVFVRFALERYLDSDLYWGGVRPAERP